MPTGYTSDVATGEITDLRTFALLCARGMGALVTMRDEPLDAPIPERLEPSTSYRDEKLAELRTELAVVSALTYEECAAQQEYEIAEAQRRRTQYVEDRARQRDRYEAMLAKVEAWRTGAEGIRGFMLSQLRESIRFDCGGDYLPSVPEPMDPVEWREARLVKLRKDIAYHEQERAQEIARTEERNRWLKALRDSLPLPEPEVCGR